MSDINDIFNEYYENKDNIEDSVDSLKEELSRFKDKIVLYGAGSAGIAFFNYLKDVGIGIKCFADGDCEKWGTRCEGIEVIDYRTIVNRVGADSLVIVTINTDGVSFCKSFKEEIKRGGHAAVIQRLREVGCNNRIDYAYFRKYKEHYKGDAYNLLSCSDVYAMQENESSIELE